MARRPYINEETAYLAAEPVAETTEIRMAMHAVERALDRGFEPSR